MPSLPSLTLEGFLIDMFQRIAVDEISSEKARRYLIVVMNPAIGAVVFVGDDKGAKALTPFWESVDAAGQNVFPNAVAG